MAKKNYVIDTSVFLSDADCIHKFGNADIFISLGIICLIICELFFFKNSNDIKNEQN